MTLDLSKSNVNLPEPGNFVKLNLSVIHGPESSNEVAFESTLEGGAVNDTNMCYLPVLNSNLYLEYRIVRGFSLVQKVSLLLPPDSKIVPRVNHHKIFHGVYRNLGAIYLTMKKTVGKKSLKNLSNQTHCIWVVKNSWRQLRKLKIILIHGAIKLIKFTVSVDEFSNIIGKKYALNLDNIIICVRKIFMMKSKYDKKYVHT